MDVECAADRGDGLFIQVRAHAWRWSGMVGGLAARHTTHERASKAGSASLSTVLRRQAGKERRIVGVVIDMQFLELGAAERGDAQGNVLQVLFALLSRNSDLLENTTRLLGEYR